MHRRARLFLPDHPMPYRFAWLPAFDTEGTEGSGGPGGTPSAEPATGDVTASQEPEKDWKAEAERLKALARKHEDRAKENFEWRKANETKVQQYDALAEASKSEADRAIEEALRKGREEGRAEADKAARDRYAPRIVGASLAAAAPSKGLTPEQITTLAGDPKRFLGDDGELDDDALRSFLDAIPAATTVPAGVTPPGPRVSAGQGARTPAKTSGVDAGRALYEQMHPNKRRTA